MPLVLILFLLLACSPVPWPEPWLFEDPATPIAVTTILLGVTWLRAALITRRALETLKSPFRQTEALIVYQTARSRHQLWVMAAFAISLFAGGWGWFANLVFANPANGNRWAFCELLIIAPFLLGLLGSWLIFYRVERDLQLMAGEEPTSRLGYLRFQFRQQLGLVCIPFGVIIIEQSLARSAPELVEQTWFRILSIGLIFSLLIASPWAIRWLLGLYPIPAGPLRDRLVKAAHRMKLRYSDLLIWPTRGAVANAMIAGLLPRPRYVLFTDRLIDILTPDELEAVLGHEVGHVRHVHLGLYVLFLILSLAVLVGLANVLDRFLTATGLAEGMLAPLADWQAFISLLVMAVYVVIAFGFLSRRCEREADLYGCRAVSCDHATCEVETHGKGRMAVTSITTPCRTGVDTFVSALEKVAVMNGLSRSRPGWLASWQHSTIAKRVDFLERVRDNPELDARYRRRLRWIKGTVLVGLAAAVVVFMRTGDLPTTW